MENLRKYEYVDGVKVDSSLVGKKVPVAPEWVRNRSGMPERAKWACLSKEIESFYPAHVRDVLVSYVRDWPLVKQGGTDLLIAGKQPTSTLRWAASAVVNEIIMRFGHLSAVTTRWFPPGNLTWLLDARKRGAEEYTAVRNMLLNRKILFVDNPLAVAKDSEGVWFLKALYQHRYDNRLPTITTLPIRLEIDGWRPVTKLLGSDVTDILQENHHEYLAHY